MSTAPAATLGPGEIRRIFGGLAIGMLLAALDGTIVATALPTMAGELGGVQYLPWVFTAYLLTSTVTVPLYGRFSDVVGRKPLLHLAIGLFVLGSLASGIAQTMLQLVLARGLQGLGAGGLVTLAMTIVGDIIPPRQRGRYQGYITSVFAVSSLTGPLIGGFFVDHLSWRWAFLVNLPLSLVAVVLIERHLDLPFMRRPQRVDVAGAALLTGSVVALLLVTVVGEESGWSSPGALALAALGLAGVGALVVQERRAADPILPPALFRDDIFTVSNSLNLLMGVALFAATVFLPLYLQVALGVSATASGLHVMPMSVALLVSSILGGRWVVRTGRYKPSAVIGTGALLLGSAILTQLGPDSSPYLASAALFVVGTGIGVSMPMLTVAIQNSVPHEHLGAATSMTDYSRKLGGVFGVSLLGALLNARIASAFASSTATGGLPADLDTSKLLDTPARIAELPVAVQGVVRSAVADGTHLVLLVGVVFAVAAFALSWRLRELPLRDDLPIERSEDVDNQVAAI